MERSWNAGDRIWVADMEPSERYPLYTCGNTGEVFPHVLSALGGTLMGDGVGRAQMEVFREIGFVTPRDRGHQARHRRVRRLLVQQRLTRSDHGCAHSRHECLDER